MHDKELSRSWHTIKCVLLNEMQTCDTFDKCIKVADALFHARLLAESTARSLQKTFAANCEDNEYSMDIESKKK